MHDPQAEEKKMNDYQQMEHDLSLHSPQSDLTKMKMERLRADAKNFGVSILSNSPESRERSLALTNLEQALQWAVEAIARHQ